MTGPLVLDESASVKLDANGNGTVRLGPSSTRQTWNVTQMSVRVTSNTREPTAIVYQNTKASILANTYSGSLDGGPVNAIVRNGFIACEWTGGDAGAVATLFLQGTIVVGG